jgi:DGQHR domain-containing protein
VAAIQTRASPVRQGNLKLFTTSLRVRDLVSDGFYSVETLDPTNPGDKGYQRLLNEARARRLADYVLNGLDAQDSFLPTSVFLATAAPLDFDEETSTLTIDPAITGSFSVVDGQHRLEGLRLAAQRDDRTLDFELPVNIAVELPHLHQMCHFLIVNSTQKSVDKSVEQRIGD